MATVEISGSSDDLIEVEGDILEEFSACDEAKYLAFSDGTVLKIEYTNGGLWRIVRFREGTSKYEKYFEATDPDDDYSDRVRLEGDIAWVVCGDGFAKLTKKKASADVGS